MSWVEVVAWLVFASFALAVVSSIGLLSYAALRAMFFAQPTATRPSEIPNAGELVLRRNPVSVGAIWTSLFILVPLLVLALWALADDLGGRRVGAGLAFAIIHSILLWQLVRYGTRVQREIALTHSALRVQPVFGRSKEFIWSSIADVDEVTYAGFGVNGLYVRTSDGATAILDRGLPEWQWLRETVRRLTPTANWRVSQRAALG